MDLRRAIRLQQQMATRLILEWRGGRIRRVAGADSGYDADRQKILAVIVVMDFPDLDIVEVARAVRPVKMPYVPGFLSFREGPAFLTAYRRLRSRPDVTFLDGNGIAHPRRMGLASHVGVLLDIPTVGCAKSPFFPFRPPSQRRGAYTHFKNQDGERVGFCLRTRAGVRPVFVSPGHLVSFALARKVALDCSRFRIPEPLREAHRLTREILP
jgi:deoxyribonuclease V